MAEWNARPSVKIEVIRDESDKRGSRDGFVRVRRVVLRNHYDGGRTSREYSYDCAERDSTDAVAIVLVDARGRVCLRSSIRPPLRFRPDYDLPFPEQETGDPTLFEIPAGLIEPGERGEDGLLNRCVAETMEEVGLRLEPSEFQRLGPPVYLTPGLIGEKIHFFWARVDPSLAVDPTTDGNPVEEVARIEWVALGEVLDACRDGRLCDIKTEVGARRLHELPGYDHSAPHTK